MSDVYHSTSNWLVAEEETISRLGEDGEEHWDLSSNSDIVGGHTYEEEEGAVTLSHID